MIRDSWTDVLFTVCNKLFLAIVLLLVCYPLIYIISASISDPILVNQGKLWLWPQGITFEGFERVFHNKELWVGYRNTILYTTVGTAINLLVTLPCAYALSRGDMVGRNAIMAAFVFTMFFGGGLIPTYLLIKNLGMTNTVWALLIPNAATIWNIIVCRTFFQMNIPKELQESAEIDGCSNTRLFVSIVLPLSAPIIAVMSLFYGVGHWNAFFNALIYLSDRSLFPLQLILKEILVQQQVSSDMMTGGGGDLDALAVQARIAEIVKYAVIIVSTLPVIIVYPFVQRYFVKGVLIGSIKG